MNTANTTVSTQPPHLRSGFEPGSLPLALALSLMAFGCMPEGSDSDPHDVDPTTTLPHTPVQPSADGEQEGIRDHSAGRFIGPCSVVTRSGDATTTVAYSYREGVLTGALQTIQLGAGEAPTSMFISTEQTFDDGGRPVVIISRDEQGQLISETRTEYDDHGHRTRTVQTTILPSGPYSQETDIENEYDNDGRLVRISHVDGAGAPVVMTLYYGADGRLASSEQTNAQGDEIAQCSYDGALDRALHCTGPGIETTNTYDAHGNPLTGTVRYTDANGMPPSVTEYDYACWANGNLDVEAGVAI